MRVSEKGSYDLFIDCKTLLRHFSRLLFPFLKLNFRNEWFVVKLSCKRYNAGCIVSH